eukprot:g2113.t1
MRPTILCLALALIAATASAEKDIVCTCPHGPGDSDKCAPGKEECVATWLLDGGFVAIIIVVMIVFWALALVCEEFFVPALNVMCTEAKIPDDVAGATFMAAGASCPELFLAYISIFVDKSTLGLGVVIGSEVFNQMVICAASVLYAQGGVLKVDWRVVTRDCGGYAIACIMLIWIVINKSCGQPGSNECPKTVEPDGTKHIDIPWWESLILVLSYAVYALVASYFNTSIVPMLCPINGATAPVSANEADTYVQINDDQAKPRSSTSASSYSAGGSDPRKSSRALAAMLPNTAAAMAQQNAVGERISDVVHSDQGSAIECYLYKKNRLYAKMQLSSLKWMLRWCTIDANEFTTCKNRDTKEGLVHMDVYTCKKVEVWKVEQHQFKMTTGDGEEFFFRAQSAESMHECIQKIQALIDKYSQLSMPERQDLLAKAGNSAYGDEEEHHESLIAWPKNPTAIAVSLHLLLFPLNKCVEKTIDDERQQQAFQMMGDDDLSGPDRSLITFEGPVQKLSFQDNTPRASLQFYRRWRSSSTPLYCRRYCTLATNELTYWHIITANKTIDSRGKKKRMSSKMSHKKAGTFKLMPEHTFRTTGVIGEFVIGREGEPDVVLRAVGENRGDKAKQWVKALRRATGKTEDEDELQIGHDSD